MNEVLSSGSLVFSMVQSGQQLNHVLCQQFNHVLEQVWRHFYDKPKIETIDLADCMSFVTTTLNCLM